MLRVHIAKSLASLNPTCENILLNILKHYCRCLRISRQSPQAISWSDWL